MKRPVVRYHGGKFKLAEWIISNMPAHRVYVEPFGGGASVLIKKPRAYAEIYNDRWDRIVNVFRVLRDPAQAERLIRAIELTPFSRVEFDACDVDAGDDPIEVARKTIFRSFAGFGSSAVMESHTTGFRASSSRSGTTPAHDWRNYPAHIPDFVERMRSVVIENRDAAAVMLQHDSPDTLHYVDPPYPHSTRGFRRRNAGYAFEMTDDDHRALAEVLRSLKGMVMVSTYRSDLYADLYRDWARKEQAAHADGALDRVEVLYLNGPCSMGALQKPLDWAAVP